MFLNRFNNMSHFGISNILIPLKKKSLCYLLTISFIFSLFIHNSPTEILADGEQSWPAQPDIFAECGVLIEASTGAVLYDKSCHQQMYPASITKIMTTLLALENGNLSDMVEFYHYDVFSLELGDAHIARQEGELLSLKDTLHAVMLASANECANATGEYVARKTEAYQRRIEELNSSGESYDESLVALEIFADMMNKRAKELGAQGTHFNNPSGLFSPEHYTTCYDMAMIMRGAVKNDDFLKIESNLTYTIPTTNKATEPQAIANRHKMLYPGNNVYYEGILGGKTGYVDQSGSTLVTSAKRNGMTLIAVVMRSNGANVYNDTKLLLDYGFNNFSLQNISENETTFSSNSSSSYNNLETVFGTNESIIELNHDGNAVLPKGASLSDCKSELTFIDTADQVDNSIAKIQYYYNSNYVGETSLVVNRPEDTYNFGPSKTENNKKDKSSNNNNFIIINIWIVAGIIILAAIVIIVIKYTKTIQNINRSRRRRRRLRNRNRGRNRKIKRF